MRGKAGVKRHEGVRFSVKEAALSEPATDLKQHQSWKRAVRSHAFPPNFTICTG
jgi:hypothetical protein